jgi:O-antigen ligase
MGLALIWSLARSAQLGVFATAVFLMFTLPPGRWRRAGTAGLAAVVVVMLAIPVIRTRAVESFTDEKEVTRPNLWRSSVAGIADRPLLGWGPGNFAVMLEHHEVPGYYESRAHSHNDFLMHAVNGGILGLAAAVWLLVAIVRACWTGWRRGGPGSWLLLGGVAVQVGISVAGMFQVFQTDDECEIVLYLVLGCCLALTGADRRPAAAGH